MEPGQLVPGRVRSRVSTAHPVPSLQYRLLVSASVATDISPKLYWPLNLQNLTDARATTVIKCFLVKAIDIIVEKTVLQVYNLTEYAPLISPMQNCCTQKHAACDISDDDDGVGVQPK